MEVAAERGWGRPGNPRRAHRAVAEALVECTIVDGSTGTARNTTLERLGAWALRGRAWEVRGKEQWPKE